MPRRETTRSRSSSITWIIVGALLGYPLGVLGTICVAVVAMTVLIWIFSTVMDALGLQFGQGATMPNSVLQVGTLMGVYGGVYVGLVTGGHVFVVVAIMRPLLPAWVCVFGACTIASLVGIGTDLGHMDTGAGAQPALSANFVAYPAIMLLVASTAFVCLTRRHSNFRGLRGSRPYYCPECGYRAHASHDPTSCAACGRART